jgi:ABC-type branched-subunit amino acid transport system ATPase component
MVAELLGMARRIADAGTTVLMVEQNVKKAMAVADRGLCARARHAGGQWPGHAAGTLDGDP